MFMKMIWKTFRRGIPLRGRDELLDPFIPATANTIVTLIPRVPSTNMIGVFSVTPRLGLHRQTAQCPYFSLFTKKVNGEFVLRACFELLRLLRGCGRRSCFCRRLVVGKVAVVPIVLSVAVDGAGGESVRNMLVLRI